MKIKVNESENYNTLSEIACGECFIPKNGEDVFLKTCVKELIYASFCFKCVNLRTGEILTFSNNRFVRAVDSEVIVNER